MFPFNLFKRTSGRAPGTNVANPEAELVQELAAVVSLPVFGYVYSAVCRANNKGYIGQTTQQPEERWQQHRQDATARKQMNGLTKRFHFALHEHGENTFEFKVIDTAISREELNEKERYWVAHYKYDNPVYGYNSTSGGAGQKEQLAHGVGRQPDNGSKSEQTSDRRATDPQKSLLRKFYQGTETTYCICSNSQGNGDVCANCQGRTDLSAEHATRLITEGIAARTTKWESESRKLRDLLDDSKQKHEDNVHKAPPLVPTDIEDVGNMLVQELPPENYESSELRWQKTCRGNYSLSLYVFRSSGTFITSNGHVSIFGVGRVNDNVQYYEKYHLTATIHDQTFEGFYPTFALAIKAADKLVETKAPEDYKRLRRDYEPPADNEQRGYLKTLYGDREFPADLSYREAQRLIKEHFWTSPSIDKQKQKIRDDAVVAGILEIGDRKVGERTGGPESIARQYSRGVLWTLTKAAGAFARDRLLFLFPDR
jgi:hypothetical protein